MGKKKKIILIVIAVILVLLTSSIIILKVNNFDFKRFKFNNTKQVLPEDKEKENEEQEDTSLNEEEVLSEEDLLPSEEDVTLNDNQTTTVANSSSGKKKTTTKATKKASSGSQKNQVSSVSTAKFESDINVVKLNPIKTRHPELDNKVGSIINSVTNSSMTNNQKLYAVFRYIIDHSEYGNGIIYQDDLDNLINQYHYSELDGRVVYNAKKILDSGYGVCDDYASLFVVMARRLGFDAYFVGGSVKKAGGGTTGHAWVNIIANGTYYVFDAQIADKRPKEEKFYYGKTDKEITIYSYKNRASYISDFNRFKETAPLKLQVNLSGPFSDSKTVASYSRNIIEDVEYDAYLNQTLNLNIKMSGASSYKYCVTVYPPNASSQRLYDTNYDKNSNVNLNYKFDKTGNYRFNISTWSEDTGVIAEYYFSVYISEDDRIKDVNFTYTKDVNHYSTGDSPYMIFNSSVVKYNEASTCTPEVEYTFVSTDDPRGSRGIYSKDGGPRINMDYTPGYTYNIKITARCGMEKFEKTVTVS